VSAAIKRREFITLLGGAAAAWPLATRVACTPARAMRPIMSRSLASSGGSASSRAKTSSSIGAVTGCTSSSSRNMQLVKAQVDVILAGGDAAVRAAQRATTKIPILALTDDMIGQGFVISLAKPGGNTTGVTILASELDGKRQEILIEAVPGARHIAALADTNVTRPLQLQALEDAARTRGVELSILRLTRPEEIAPALDAAKASGAEALNVLASALFFNNRTIILDRVAALSLPAMYLWPEWAEEGGLIGYGPRVIQLFRDVLSRQLAALLRGAKPADIPVEQPTRFELVVNLKAAKAIGHEVPAGLVLRADEVIE
jgi:ABC-type uncharacterized transport system substrate-binding protein